MDAQQDRPKPTARLAQLHEQMREHPSSVKAGTTIADRLRTELPDLDDATIGRVVLEVSIHLSAAGDRFEALLGSLSLPTSYTAALKPLIRAVLCAAIQLTEIEWREETP
uniref:hypothetical protein n=1 Tax=Actinomadura sp. CA-154981 TaxID=3240037 RepID=UPI003F490A57